MAAHIQNQSRHTHMLPPPILLVNWAATCDSHLTNWTGKAQVPKSLVMALRPALHIAGWKLQKVSPQRMLILLVTKDRSKEKQKANEFLRWWIRATKLKEEPTDPFSISAAIGIIPFSFKMQEFFAKCLLKTLKDVRV